MRSLFSEECSTLYLFTSHCSPSLNSDSKVDSFNSLMTLQYVHAGITSILLFLVLLYFPRWFHRKCSLIFILSQIMFCKLIRIDPLASLQSHQATLQLKKEQLLGEQKRLFICSHLMVACFMLNIKVLVLEFGTS